MNIHYRLFFALMIATSICCLKSEEKENALLTLGFEDWEEPTQIEIVNAYEYQKSNTKQAEIIEQIENAYQILINEKVEPRKDHRYAKTEGPSFSNKDFEDIFAAFNDFGEFIVINEERENYRDNKEEPEKPELNLKSFIGWCRQNWQIIFAALLISYGIVTIWQK